MAWTIYVSVRPCRFANPTYSTCLLKWIVGWSVWWLGSRNAVDEKTVLIIPKIWFVVVVVWVWGVKEPNRCTHFSETYIPMELSNESCDEDCQHLGRVAPSGLFRKRVLCYMMFIHSDVGDELQHLNVCGAHGRNTNTHELGPRQNTRRTQQGRPGKLRSFRSVRCKMMIVGCEIGGARKVEQPSEIQTATAVGRGFADAVCCLNWQLEWSGKFKCLNRVSPIRLLLGWAWRSAPKETACYCNFVHKQSKEAPNLHFTLKWYTYVCKFCTLVVATHVLALPCSSLCV